MKRILLLALLLTGFFPLAAQDYAEYYKYAEEAREMSMLFRGKQGMTYQFPHNGTYFWYGREFKKGDVFYNGKLYRDILVNVNAHRQELLVKQSESLLPVLADADYVEWFTMEGALFVNLALRGRDDVQPGFYQVLYEGDSSLYKRVDKIIRKDSQNRNGVGIGYYDPRYNEKILDYFANREVYYFDNDGRFEPVKKLRGIVSAFPDRSKVLKKYIKSAGLKQMDFEKASVLLLEFAENE